MLGQDVPAPNFKLGYDTSVPNPMLGQDVPAPNPMLTRTHSRLTIIGYSHKLNPTPLRAEPNSF
jgi:hypothetical protein